MRLHALQVTAFGPFADSVAVDFDELASDGLFLLSGPTGSGKTSILDAVCFALYGDVPGDRGSAKRLRSDQAAPGVAPEVALEFTVRARRFRLVRSPQWTRPKKRGTGVTTEQAHVVCSELVDGTWTPLSNRLDETGHLITGLLGMNMAQFCQVALLPQGQFQGFLRARSEERHALLQRLFATDRFEQIERWLRDHARALRREVGDSEVALGRAISRVEEAAGTAAPDEVSETVSWLDAEVGRSLQEAQRAATMLTDTAARRADADLALIQARELARRQQLGAEAERTLAALAQETAAHERRVEVREAAQRAAVVLPLVRVATEASVAQSRYQAAVDAALTDAVRLRDTAYASGYLHDDGGLPFDDIDALALLLGPAEERLREADTLVPLASEVAAINPQITALGHEVAERDAAIERVQAEAVEAPEERNRLEAALRESVAESDRAQLLAGEVATLRTRLAAAERLVLRRADLTRAEAGERAATERLFAVKEAWLSAQESRLHGMAAELAAELASGDACPVCGSGDHPEPAQTSPSTSTADEVKAARSLVDDAELARATAESELRSLSADVARLTEAAGDGTVAELAALLAGKGEELARAEQAAARLPTTQQALDRLAATQEAREQKLIELSNQRTAAVATCTTLEARRDHLRQQLGARADEPRLLATLRAEQRLGSELVTALSTAMRHRERLVEATASVQRAEAELRATAAAQRFASPREAADAALDAGAVRALEAAIAEYEDRRRSAQGTLDLPDVIAALAAPAPDLTQLATTADAAQVAEAEAIRSDTGARRRNERVAALAVEVRATFDALAPRREAAQVAAELAAMVEGKSTNNALRMRLSAYVLSWRLAQVVDAANERLSRMSDSRYLLEHSEQRGAHESRGGLSLVVRDGWSGEARDPATLSGGETFVVSLALALGLADVVAGEAGGTELDTLFVDEGFGSLDAETLDDVMDTLDALREGGRVVGVVSHVDQMRSRIPRQLRLTKGRTGSTVEVSYLTA
ncbi:AAA family ATPase [Nocardioides sp. Bht2]|uniref:AAA family ATPase n=1 Tax=Nocardioides sp. Bht2 TaxID=3392297 RepID=UPI0039B56514